MLSFASAFLQAAVAVAVVGIAAGILQATARTMNAAVWWIEVVSYGLIALMGARLDFREGTRLRRTRCGRDRQGAVEGAGQSEAAHVHAHSCAHHHDHGSHSHGAPSHARRS